MCSAFQNAVKCHGFSGAFWYTLYMATAESTAEYLADQVATAGRIRTRKMFGEYALYCNDKVVALICDDRLYVKPTDAGKAFIGDVTEGNPYPGAKPFFLIEEEYWEDRDWLAELVRITAGALPVPTIKKPKKKSS
jgi:DNA transformation protein